MKRSLTVLLCLVLLFCLGRSVLAEGFSIFGDYGFFTNSVDDRDVTILRIGGEWSITPSFFAGGQFETILSYDPEPSPAQKNDLYFLYGGYRFVNDGTYTLAAIGGYHAWRKEDEAAPYSDFSLDSLGIGILGSATWERVECSLLYFYGASNTLKIYSDGVLDYETEDLGFTYLNITGGYSINDNLQVYLYYAVLAATPDAGGEFIDASGFGLGVKYKF